MSGWYKQQRNLSERAWYKDSAMVHVYHFLKERAYVADGRYEGYIIRRGSCPITRSEISEMTGLSLRTLDRVLRRLISYEEIIVKGNSRFSIISVCDYDTCATAESLFGSTDGISNGTTDGISNGTTDGTTHISTIEERRNNKEDSLVSPFSPYKSERESEDLAYEIKKRYNRTFDGKLPQCIRLTMPTRVMIGECLRRFGTQSVDLVFEQVLSEPFSLGQNKTGFSASLQFIFEPKNFQGYLERAKLRRQKQQTVRVEEVAYWPATETEPQPTEDERRESRRARLVEMTELAAGNPRSTCVAALQQAYATGELQQLGIDWKPNNI